MGRKRIEEQRSARKVEREIEGTGLCAQAQGDGVPCGGVSRLCWECGEGIPCTCTYADLSPEEKAELLGRAGL